MNTVVIDFETRSTVKLKSCGMYVYAESPDTQVMCLAVVVNDQRPALWVPDYFWDKINPAHVLHPRISTTQLLNITNSADKLVAHNAGFEYAIWNGCTQWPKLPLHKLHCTAAQCAYHALPLSLDQAGAALNLPTQKDAKGHSIMLKLCKPRKPRKDEDPDAILWHEDPGDLEALFNYAGRDVETERLIHNTLAELPDFERKIWLLDQKINLRGIPIDIENVKAIVKMTAEREEMLLARFQDLTDGAVSGPRSYVKLKEWVNEQTGLELTSVDKNTTAELLEQGDLPEHVMGALRVKAELAKASTAKFKAMLDRASADGRVRGVFMYGAASTLRWGGRGIQAQNLPRDSYKPAVYEQVAELFRAGDAEMIQALYDDPFFVASRCVRGSICTAPDREFICSDFSSIEARALAWLADDQPALRVFDQNLDPYIVAAQRIFNMAYEDIGDPSYERQVGKVSELALGYGGGIGAYATMARGYGIDLETLPKFIMPHATGDEMEGPFGAFALAKKYLSRNPPSMSFKAAVACDIIKRKWRANRPATTQFWKDVGAAAYAAVQNPNRVFRAGPIKYCCNNDFLKCMMPSGRLMHYYKPSIRLIDNPFADEDEKDPKKKKKPAVTYMGMKVVDGKTTRQWSRLASYDGKWVENIDQGFCRDLLAAAMLRLEAAGYPTVLHVHDEPAAEKKIGTSNLGEYNRIMSMVPDWAAGMPIKAEGWIGRRYRK